MTDNTDARLGRARSRLQRGLYLITPQRHLDASGLVGLVSPLLPATAVLQFRDKISGHARRLACALALREACSAAGVALIVNDDPALAAAVGADGVHLGEYDGAVTQARALLGSGAIIGVSCYGDIERAMRAAEDGADYIAFGAFHPSPSKPRARRASPGILRDARFLGLQQVAIGGITPDNAPILIAAGADCVAVISGVFDAIDPLAAARAYAACFSAITTGRP